MVAFFFVDRQTLSVVNGTAVRGGEAQPSDQLCRVQYSPPLALLCCYGSHIKDR